MLIPKNILLGILIIRNERATSRFNVLHKHVPVYIQNAPATILARPQVGSLFSVKHCSFWFKIFFTKT